MAVLRLLSLSFLMLVGSLAYGQKVGINTFEDIIGRMDEQIACWNNGELECYMEGYWRNDSLRFITKNGVTRGWDATLERYKKAYPTKEEMGKLTLTADRLLPICGDKVLVLGSWHLNINGKEKQGYYTLIWQYIEGEWLIIADHTS